MKLTQNFNGQVGKIINVEKIEKLEYFENGAQKSISEEQLIQYLNVVCSDIEKRQKLIDELKGTQTELPEELPAVLEAELASPQTFRERLKAFVTDKGNLETAGKILLAILKKVAELS